MQKVTAALTVLLTGSLVQAASVTNDFNRIDTAACIDFESADSTNDFEIVQSAYARLTTAPEPVLRGSRSLLIDTLARTGEWNIAARTRPGLFAAGGRYRVELIARVLDEGTAQTDNYFYYMVRSLSNPQWSPLAKRYSDEGAGPVEKRVLWVDVPPDVSDLSLQLGAHWNVRAVIDDIRISPVKRLSEDVLSSPGEILPGDEPYEPFGLCVHADRSSGGLFYTDQEVQDALVMWEAMGVQWLRVSIPGNLYPTEDALNQDQPDPVRHARLMTLMDGLNQRGIRFYLQLSPGNEPRWAARETTPSSIRREDYSDWAVPMADLTIYRTYMENIARRYGTASDYWEVGNEMDWTFWGSTPERYLEALTIARTALRAVNGNAKIIMGGLGCGGISSPLRGKSGFLQRLYDGGLKDLTDILAVHVYEKDPAGYIAEINRFYAVMVQNGDADKRIWITETGISAMDGQEQFQADFLQNLYTRLIMHPAVDKIFWWNFKPPLWPTDRFAFMSLVDKTLAPRPAYWTYKALPKNPEHRVNSAWLDYE